MAASQGHVEIVHLLVSAGARRQIPDNMDQTPEGIANFKEYRESIQYFKNLRVLNGVLIGENGTLKWKKVIFHQKK